jgi:hypothetical protein
VSFASPLSSNLRRVPGELEPTPGFGRGAIVASVDRWYATPGPTADLRAALLVLDVDIDDALPSGGAEEDARRRRLGRSVERAISARVRPGDAVARIDAGRFAVLRGGLPDDHVARGEAAELAREIEDALVGRPEGYGVRVTAGAATLVRGHIRAGREALGSVTTAMLQGKLLSDDRVVVVVAAGG